MKLIGIMGNSGSGKTTFTEYLETKESVGVIHIDSLTCNIKKKYFKLFLQPKEKNSTENDNPRVKREVKAAFYKNKYAFNLLMNVRNKLMEKELEKQIQDLKKAGKKVIVIDDWALPTQKKLMPKFSHIYIMKRKFNDRRRGLEIRDSLTREDAKVHDLPYALKYIKKPNQSNVSYITNYGTIEELYASAEDLYQSLGELSFDERYSVRGKINFRDVAIKLGKVREIGDNVKSESKEKNI